MQGQKGLRQGIKSVTSVQRQKMGKRSCSIERVEMSKILQPSLTVSYYVTLVVSQKYSCRAKPVSEVFTCSFAFQGGEAKLSSHTIKGAATSMTIMKLS